MSVATAVTRTWASLSIHSRTLDPDDVTARLAISPSDAHKVGERHGKGGRLVWKDGHWSLTSEEQIEATDLEAHIAWILDRIEPVGEQFRQLTNQAGVKARIFCYWESEEVNAVLDFSPELLSRLGALNLRLAIDVWFDF